MITDEQFYAAAFAHSRQENLKKAPMFIDGREVAFILYLLDIFSEEQTVAKMTLPPGKSSSLNLADYERLAVQMLEESIKSNDCGRTAQGSAFGRVARKIRRLGELLT